LKIFIKLVIESFLFAWSALRTNILRTVLSLLGVTVGIFSIIGVLTMVDSLEKSIRDSLDFLGSDVLYLQKMPFVFDNEAPWWIYNRRPNISFREFELMSENLNSVSKIAIFSQTGRQTLKYGNNSISNIILNGGSYEYKDIFDMDIIDGRYFSTMESESGRDVVILGYKLRLLLFGEENPIGKFIKLKNRKFLVVGTLKEEGEGFLGNTSEDENAFIPYNSFRKMFSTGSGVVREIGSMIALKGYPDDVGLNQLEGEAIGLMRSARGLKPKEDDNFAFNRPEAIGKMLDNIFSVLSKAGWFIGVFSMLIGGFGIANIMFVSVKERTNIIGIQKSLGAKNYFILFQFLFESIFLSVLGGFGGLFLVFMLSFLPMGSMDLVLSFKNIALGLSVSSVIGIVSGIIPAALAARMDPVTAIRTA